MPNVFIIEDQTILRELVCRLVSDLKGYQLIGDSADGLEGLEACQKLKPDLAIVDIMVPSLNGLEIVRQLKKSQPAIKLIIFSAHSTRDQVQTALKSGVNGIVHKNASVDELEKSIHSVMAGQSYMSGQILEIMRDLMLNPQVSDTLDKLTTREREILQLIAEGNTTKEIAYKLEVSVKTADTHRTNVMSKLDIHDIAGLTRFAIHCGLIEV